MRLLCEATLNIVELYKNYFSYDTEVHLFTPSSPMFIFTVKFNEIISGIENVPPLAQCYGYYLENASILCNLT